MESVAKETYLKREIEESYEQLETTFDEEDEDENLYKNKIKTINQKIKKLKYEKKNSNQNTKIRNMNIINVDKE